MTRSGSRSRGFGGTQVPEPLSPRSRSRVEQWDIGAGAEVRQTYRTFTTSRRWEGGAGWTRTSDQRIMSPPPATMTSALFRA